MENLFELYPVPLYWVKAWALRDQVSIIEMLKEVVHPKSSLRDYSK